MRAVWVIIGLAAAVLLPALTAAAPEGRFEERLRQAERRYATPRRKESAALKPAASKRAAPKRTASKPPAPKRPASRPVAKATTPTGTRSFGKRSTKVVRARRSAWTATRRTRSSQMTRRRYASRRGWRGYARQPASRQEPIVASLPRGYPDRATVTYSFEPRMPGTDEPEYTGDVLLSSFPRHLEVRFEFDYAKKSSKRDLLMQGLDPQELRVRAYAPKLRMQIETWLPIKPGAMTQAQFFFPIPTEKLRARGR